MSKNAESTFDRYAGDYEAALEKGIGVSGEDRDFFARERVAWTAARVETRGESLVRGLDFGCGTGDTAPLLLDGLGLDAVVGVDVSAESIEEARARHRQAGVTFSTLAGHTRSDKADIAYCNGVFHHIVPEKRADAAAWVREALRPGGLFALWENNPWNPGTRYVMSRIPFDRDAQTLTAPEAVRLLSQAGFEVIRTDFLFVFPRMLSFFRPMEPWLARWPLGAQYQVLACRPPDG